MAVEYVRGDFQPHPEDRMIPWLCVSCGSVAWAVHRVECSPRGGAGDRGGRDGDLIPRPCQSTQRSLAF